MRRMRRDESQNELDARDKAIAWAQDNPQEMLAVKKNKQRYDNLVETLLNPGRTDIKHGPEGDRWMEDSQDTEVAALVMNADGEVFLAVQDTAYPFSSSRMWIEEVQRDDHERFPYNVKGFVCLTDYDDARESFETRQPEEADIGHMVKEIERFFGGRLAPAAVTEPAEADAQLT